MTAVQALAGGAQFQGVINEHLAKRSHNAMQAMLRGLDEGPDAERIAAAETTLRTQETLARALGQRALVARRAEGAGTAKWPELVLNGVRDNSDEIAKEAATLAEAGALPAKIAKALGGMARDCRQIGTQHEAQVWTRLYGHYALAIEGAAQAARSPEPKEKLAQVQAQAQKNNVRRIIQELRDPELRSQEQTREDAMVNSGLSGEEREVFHAWLRTAEGRLGEEDTRLPIIDQGMTLELTALQPITANGRKWGEEIAKGIVRTGDQWWKQQSEKVAPRAVPRPTTVREEPSAQVVEGDFRRRDRGTDTRRGEVARVQASRACMRLAQAAAQTPIGARQRIRSEGSAWRWNMIEQMTASAAPELHAQIGRGEMPPWLEAFCAGAERESLRPWPKSASAIERLGYSAETLLQAGAVEKIYMQLRQAVNTCRDCESARVHARLHSGQAAPKLPPNTEGAMRQIKKFELLIGEVGAEAGRWSVPEVAELIRRGFAELSDQSRHRLTSAVPRQRGQSGQGGGIAPPAEHSGHIPDLGDEEQRNWTVEVSGLMLQEARRIHGHVTRSLVGMGPGTGAR